MTNRITTASKIPAIAGNSILVFQNRFERDFLCITVGTKTPNPGLNSVSHRGVTGDQRVKRNFTRSVTGRGTAPGGFLHAVRGCARPRSARGETRQGLAGRGESAGWCRLRVGRSEQQQPAVPRRRSCRARRTLTPAQPPFPGRATTPVQEHHRLAPALAGPQLGFWEVLPGEEAAYGPLGGPDRGRCWRVTKPPGFVTTCGRCPMSAAARRHVPAFI